MNPRIWYLFHIASHGELPNTAGIAEARHRPGGWRRMWEIGEHGQPPLKVLSELRVPIIFHNIAGQVKGEPVQWRGRERPDYWWQDFIGDVLARYMGEVIIYSGSPHHAPWWDFPAEREHCERFRWRDAAQSRAQRWDLLSPVPGESPHNRTTMMIDEATACGEQAARVAQWMMFWKDMGYELGVEGAVWESQAGWLNPITSKVMHVHRSLRRQVNNEQARKGVAPLRKNQEQIVWVEDPPDTTPQAAVFIANQLVRVGVQRESPPLRPDGTVEPPDEFQASAQRPMSAAISCGLTPDEAREIWG